MTPVECVQIVNLIANRCPASRLGDYTADSWYPDLASVDYADAFDAVMAVSRRQAFVGLHELLTECHDIARHRLGAERAAVIAIERAAEGLTEADVEPAPPNTDWKALGEQLKARLPGFDRVKPTPKVDPRHPDTVRAEARRELDAARTSDRTEATPDRATREGDRR